MTRLYYEYSENGITKQTNSYQEALLHKPFKTLYEEFYNCDNPQILLKEKVDKTITK